MSAISLVHLIMDNEIDAIKGNYSMQHDFMVRTFLKGKFEPSFIERVFNSVKFNLEPFSSIVPLDDAVVVPYLQYSGMLSINNAESLKYCYNIENGDSMFRRVKYSYYDKKSGLYMSRDGKTANSSSITEYNQLLNTLTYLLDKPPAKEIETLFDYILSLNSHFYICFSNLCGDAKIKNSRHFFESLVREREVRKYTSIDAQSALLDLFNNPYASKSPFEVNKMLFLVS